MEKNESPFSLRRASAADSAKIAEHRYFAEPAGESRNASLDRYQDWLSGALDRGLYVGWLAVQGESVVAGAGAVLLEWGPTKDDDNHVRARLVNVYTFPDCRRRGFARALVKSVLGELQAGGIRTVSLSSTDDSRGLYEQLGFRHHSSEMTFRAFEI